jgi:hypothetical protein
LTILKFYDIIKENERSVQIPLIEIQYKKNYELKIEDLQLEKLRGV